jgi:hypothetical protein
LEHTTQNATARVEDGEFYRDTIVPLWSRFDDALTTALLPDFEDEGSTISLEFDASDVAALQEDRNEKARWVVPAFAGGGISHHALHRELGLPPPETEDFYLRGLAVEAIPAGDPLGGTARQGAPASGDDDDALSRRRLAGRGPSWRFAVGAANRRAAARIAEARRPSIAAFFAAQGERVVAAYRAPVGVAALAGANGRHALAVRDLDWGREDAALRSVLDRLYRLAGETAYGAINDQLGTSLSFDLANPHVRDVVGRLGLRVTGINAESRDLIAEAVTRGELAGKTVDEIADDLKGLFDGWSDWRASTVARTESMTGYAEASLVGYRQSGLVDRVQLLDNPAHTEPYGASDGLTCAERDGLIVPLADASRHVEAEHPNGSLSLSPVLIGEE